MSKTGEGLVINLFWKFAERTSAQLVTLIVSVILARLLEPEHYGLVSLVTIFVTIADVFVSDGLGSALIQKKKVDRLDYSSVLYFNLLLSIMLYCLLFFAAPYISAFYGKNYELIVPIFRILSLRLVLSAINSVQQAYVSKQMIFKKFFFSTLLGTVVSGVIGIVMAYNGFGVWSIVGQYLANSFVSTLVLGFVISQKPQFKFSWNRIRELYGFGLKVLATNLLIVGYQELRAVFIGKIYSSSDLAFYDQGKKFPNILVANVNTSISAVLFPKMSNEQDDIVKIKRITRNSIRFSAFIMCPMMLGLAIIAEPFVHIILTEKWLPCVPLLQIFCIVFLFQPIHTANMQAIKALGKGDVFLKLEIVKKIIELIVLLITVHISVKAIVVGMAVLTTAFTLVNSFPNAKLLNYSFVEQMYDIIPSVVRALVMATVLYIVGRMINQPMIKILVQIGGGLGIYLLLCVITKCKELEVIVNYYLKRRMHNC